jgi:WD40 repeat protein
MSALLVPIQLDVLMVRNAAERWALTAMREPSAVTSAPEYQQLLPDPFQELPGGRPLGAYLHWALPDGLTRATRSIRGDVTFPAVPDRWLVVRLSGAASPGPRTVRAWLLAHTGTQTPAVIDALSGVALPPPGEAPEKPLTALGLGDIGWAAYYDNVIGRLSFHDPLTDVTSGPIAYLVCGWYTNPALEPILAATASDFDDCLERLGWSVELQGGQPYPATSVYHGAAVSIGWPDESWPGDGGRLGAEMDTRPVPSTVDIALGETAAEALAALTSTAGGARLSRLLEGLYASALPELTQPDGVARLDTALHLARFGSKPSASDSEVIWEPRPTGATAMAPAVFATGSAVAPGSGGVLEALAASSASAASGNLALATAAPADAGPGTFVSVSRTRPRVWHALEPFLVMRGAGRGFKHGGDGRFSSTSHLACRVEGDTLLELGVEGGDPGAGTAVLPPDVLAPAAAYGMPEACAALLVELACLDPGSAPDLAQSTPELPSPVADARARWWTGWSPGLALSGALEGVHVEGTLPSPVAVTPPARPWTPLHLEWSASYLPSPRGAHDWRLGDIDFTLPESPEMPGDGATRALKGRMLLTGSAGAALASATGETEPQDLISGTLTGLMERMRADPEGSLVHRHGDETADNPPLGARPPDFTALRAGFLRLERLRLVDGYGQFLELLPGGAELVLGAGLKVTGHPGLAALTPRFTASARVLLRYAAATGEQVDASPAHSPVCGFVMPGPLDGTLEFFDAEGIPCGRLRPDANTRTAWEEDPGQDASLGAAPSRWLKNPSLGAFADHLLAADMASAEAASQGLPAPRQTALASLMRVLDVTRWTVDPTGRAGDEHLALLLGQPVVVLRATLKIDVEDPRSPPENLATSVPVRLGSLDHRDDGLLAYVVGDDYTRVYVVDPAVSELALGEGASPFIDRSGFFHVNPGTPVPLTLFMIPQTELHVTTGLLPRKAVGMLRDWTAPALSRLSPAFRYGPVLRHELTTRLPVPTDIRGGCRWHWRSAPGTWASQEILPATADAVMADAPAQASEGWLQFELAPDTYYPEEAVTVRITCVSSHWDEHGRRHLRAVGFHNPDGTHFLIPVAQAATMLESGRFSFYVQWPGTPRTVVEATTTPEGRKQLQTPSGASTNLYELPECNDWLLAAQLPSGKLFHHAVRLLDGKVLVVGGYNTATYLYHPDEDWWETTGPSRKTRRSHTATLLLNGKVLVAGGAQGEADVTTEVYDPERGTWSATGHMRTARREHTATLLRSGEVLVAGGATSAAEIYDPESGTWTATGSMTVSRSRHTATLLPDGKLLVAGGFDSTGAHLATAELYDPKSGTWTLVGSMKAARSYHTATLLKNGSVLVTGGGKTSTLCATAELYDPGTGTWAYTGAMVQPRTYHTATLLPDGRVVVAGGYDDLTGIHRAAERYDPSNGTWSTTGHMSTTRYRHAATLLDDGRVLVVAGHSTGNQAACELYSP